MIKVADLYIQANQNWIRKNVPGNLNPNGTQFFISGSKYNFHHANMRLSKTEWVKKQALFKLVNIEWIKI